MSPAARGSDCFKLQASSRSWKRPQEAPTHLAQTGSPSKPHPSRALLVQASVSSGDMGAETSLRKARAESLLDANVSVTSPDVISSRQIPGAQDLKAQQHHTSVSTAAHYYAAGTKD